MTTKLRAGVVGVGSMGLNHARVYALLDNTELAAVYDPDGAAAERAARKYRCAVASSLEDLAARTDIVTVAAPTSMHHEIGMKLLSLNRHLLVEKPISDNPTHAAELVGLARARGLVLQVGHIERFNPALAALEQRLNRPRFLEVTRLSPYPGRSLEIGVVLDVMIHDLEIILHLVRSPVTSVDAVGVAVLSKGEDIASVRLHFANGCVANVTASRISIETTRKIRLFQEDAYLSLDYQKQSGKMYRLDGGKIVRERVAIEREEPLVRELRHFVECAQAGHQPKVGGVEATAALELAVEITRQIAERAPRRGA
ncbi:MAG: Gfo/Idh/MocA family oxidoreductase [Chthoniobacterales bacterium]